MKTPTDTAGQTADIEALFYRELDACQDIPAFGEQIRRFLESMGFDTFSYSVIGVDHKRLREPKRLFATLPADLLEAYDEKKYHRHDIALDYAFHNERQAFYSDLQATLRQFPYVTEARLINREIHLLYRSHGYHDFYLLPVKREGCTSLFSVGLSDAGHEAASSE